MLAFLLVIIIIVLLLMANEQQFVITCYSKSCGHNRRNRCRFKKIEIYDNNALGICLWHTETMEKRLLEPILKGIELGKRTGKIEMIDEFTKGLADGKAIKEPDEFVKWLKRHGISKEGGNG
jgi:hypothetical protein